MVTITNDLADFGYREIQMAIKLLTAYNDQELPKDFTNKGVSINFNMDSGFVFITNAEYQTMLLDENGKLRMRYSMPETGIEGFYSDLKEQMLNDDNWHIDDKRYMKELAQYNE